MKKWFERFLDKNIYRIQDWFKSWIYPAYYLKNLLFKRYDLIKISGMKPYEYVSADQKFLYANMQILCDFLEKEEPEKYICWYKDEDGNDAGHKYGEWKDQQIIYPHLKGKWVMDIIKEIYNWWKVERPMLLDDKDYLLHIWATYIHGEMIFDDEDVPDDELVEVKFDKSKCFKTLEEFDKVVDWKVLDKYLDGDRRNILIEKFLYNKIQELKNRIWNEEQKNIHLLIDVRYCLWT